MRLFKWFLLLEKSLLDRWEKMFLDLGKLSKEDGHRLLGTRNLNINWKTENLFLRKLLI
jgi:hypothetical protein